MRKLWVVAFLFLLGVVAFLLYLISKPVSKPDVQPETEKANMVTPSPSPSPVQSIPRINTASLPLAKVGEKYQAEIFTSLTDSHGDLTIKVNGLPDGLVLQKCNQDFDIKLIPIPNTQARCFIEGIPTKYGLYSIKISVMVKNNYGNNTVEQIIALVVAKP